MVKHEKAYLARKIAELKSLQQLSLKNQLDEQRQRALIMSILALAIEEKEAKDERTEAMFRTSAKL